MPPIRAPGANVRASAGSTACVARPAGSASWGRRPRTTAHRRSCGSSSTSAGSPGVGRSPRRTTTPTDSTAPTTPATSARSSRRYLKPWMFSYLYAGINLNRTAPLKNKRRFADVCVRDGLPHIPVLGVFDRRGVRWTHEEPVSQDVFMKPVSQSGGRGVATFRYDVDSSGFVDRHGIVHTRERFESRYRELGRSTTYLATPLVRNHPAIQAISSGALSTVRVITVLDEQGSRNCAQPSCGWRSRRTPWWTTATPAGSSHRSTCGPGTGSRRIAARLEAERPGPPSDERFAQRRCKVAALGRRARPRGALPPVVPRPKGDRLGHRHHGRRFRHRRGQRRARPRPDPAHPGPLGRSRLGQLLASHVDDRSAQVLALDAAVVELEEPSGAANGALTVVSGDRDARSLGLAMSCITAPHCDLDHGDPRPSRAFE